MKRTTERRRSRRGKLRTRPVILDSNISDFSLSVIKGLYKDFAGVGQIPCNRIPPFRILRFYILCDTSAKCANTIRHSWITSPREHKFVKFLSFISTPHAVVNKDHPYHYINIYSLPLAPCLSWSLSLRLMFAGSWLNEHICIQVTKVCMFYGRMQCLYLYYDRLLIRQPGVNEFF